jgi:hypothetical protein
MIELKQNHATALILCAGVLPDFEIIENGMVSDCREKAVVLWPILDKITVYFAIGNNFESTFLDRITVIRRLVKLGLSVVRIDWKACNVQFKL